MHEMMTATMASFFINMTSGGTGVPRIMTVVDSVLQSRRGDALIGDMSTD